MTTYSWDNRESKIGPCVVTAYSWDNRESKIRTGFEQVWDLPSADATLEWPAMSPVPPTIEEEIREDIRERRAERGTLYKAISTLTTAIQTHERKDDERHIEILDRLAGHGARLSDHAAKITRLEDRADDTGQFVSLERRNKISDARFLKRSFREIVFIALKIGGSAAGGAGVYHIVRSMIGR